MIPYLSLDSNIQIPLNMALAMRRIDGADHVLKFGLNPAVGTSYEDIWYTGGTETLLSSAETVHLVSSSAADDVGSTGLTKIVIQGLDNNYWPISEEIEMNGTATVTSTKSFLRLYRAYGSAAGSGGTNAGTITMTASSSGTTFATIAPLVNQTQKTQFTIPTGMCGFLTGISISALKNNQYALDFRIKEYGAIERSLFTIQGTDVPQAIPLISGVPPLFLPKTDIKIRGLSTLGSASINVFYGLILIPEKLVNIKNRRV